MFAVVLDINGMEIAQTDFDFQSIHASKIENVDKETISKIIEAYKPEIKSMLKSAELKAQEKSQAIKKNIFQQKLKRLNEEKKRLQDLQKINPVVRDEEIEFFEKQIELLQENKKNAGIRLDAIRLLIIT